MPEDCEKWTKWLERERAARPVQTTEDNALFTKESENLTPENRVRIQQIIKEGHDAALDWEERTGRQSFLTHIDIWPPSDGSKKLAPSFHARWPKVATRLERWWNMTNDERRKECPLTFGLFEKINQRKGA